MYSTFSPPRRIRSKQTNIFRERAKESQLLYIHTMSSCTSFAEPLQSSSDVKYVIDRQVLQKPKLLHGANVRFAHPAVRIQCSLGMLNEISSPYPKDVLDLLRYFHTLDWGDHLADPS